MTKRARTIAAILGATLGAATVHAAPPGFHLAATTPHFLFYTRGKASVEPKQAERFLAEVETTLGHDVKGVAEYYRYERPEDLSAVVGEYTTGVTYAESGQIHSTMAAHRHEIVHLVSGQLGSPARFFQEGLAVALGDNGRLWGRDVDQIVRGLGTVPALAALTTQFNRHDPNVSYPVAGSFVGHLIKKHGIASVREFFRRSTGGAQTESTFAASFGQSLAQAEIEWRAAL